MHEAGGVVLVADGAAGDGGAAEAVADVVTEGVGVSAGGVAVAVYDADQLDSLSDFNGNTITIDNTADGLPSSVALASSGDTITTTYDATDSPSETALDNTSTTLLGFDYSDAPSGAIESETDTPSWSGSPAHYTYDPQGRVTQMSPGSGSDLNYSFDASNNLTTLPTSATGTYDHASELTSAVLSGTTTNLTYDTDGQRTQTKIGTTTTSSASYNGANRLTAFSNTAANMSAASYDGNGLRVSTTITPTGGSATNSSYTWDTELSSVPHVLTDGKSAYVYAFGDTPIEQVDLTAGTATYLIADSLGSVRGTVNSTGSLTGSTAYDAWGNPETSGGLTTTTPFGYAGSYTDPTNLNYLINRYYDPQAGQFISVDPLVDSTEAPYAYVNGNPINGVDANGLGCFSSFSGFGHCAARGAGSVAGVVYGYDTVKSFVDCTGSNSIYNCAVMHFDPAYYAIAGYANEAQAWENGCSLWTVAKYGAEGVVGLAATAGVAVGGVSAIDEAGYFSGREINIGDNFRISPFGNRNGDEWFKRVPHYHRRVLLPNGDTVDGQGIGWHRPWEKW